MKFVPKYDKEFYPISVKLKEYRAAVSKEQNKQWHLVRNNNGEWISDD